MKKIYFIKEKMWKAIYYNNIEKVQRLLRDGFNPNQRYSSPQRIAGILPSGTTPLSWACGWNKKEIVEILLENGADVNFANSNGWTPLISTTFGYDEDNDIHLIKIRIAEILLNQPDININHQNDVGNTALMCTNWRNVEIAELLLNRPEIDLNIRNIAGSNTINEITNNINDAIFMDDERYVTPTIILLVHDKMMEECKEKLKRRFVEIYLDRDTSGVVQKYLVSEREPRYERKRKSR